MELLNVKFSKLCDYHNHLKSMFVINCSFREFQVLCESFDTLLSPSNHVTVHVKPFATPLTILAPLQEWSEGQLRRSWANSEAFETLEILPKIFKCSLRFPILFKSMKNLIKTPLTVPRAHEFHESWLIPWKRIPSFLWQHLEPFRNAPRFNEALPEPF